MGGSDARSKARYNREYYLRNKDRIAARKRHRYETDAAYREACKDRRKKQLEKEKSERAKKTKPRNQKGPKKMLVGLPNGSQVRVGMYSLGQAAYQIGVSPQTIRKWENLGVLPPATYRTPGGHRLYTVDEVAAIRVVFRRFHEAVNPWRITDRFRVAVSEALRGLTQGIRIEEGSGDE